MYKKLIIIGISFLCMDCASIPKFEPGDQQHLTKKSITKLNGTYSNVTETSENHIHRTISGRLLHPKRKDSVSQVKINVLSDKEIQFSFLKNRAEIGFQIVKYKLQNDGFLRLRNKNFRLHGIPWVFGDYEIRRYEIGLSNTGSLIMNGVEKREGAHFIILWSPSINYKFSDIYEKK